MKLIFLESTATRAIQKIQFLAILDKYFKRYGNINHFFGMGSYQIWPYHVTQAEKLSFSYLKSYCP